MQMNCERARRTIVAGAGRPNARRAERHVQGCPACTKWLAEISEMATLLEGVPSHELPPSLAERMSGAARSVHPDRDETEGAFRRHKMRRTLIMAGAFVLAGWLALSVWSPGGRSVAVADLRQALAKVKIVHMTGLGEDGFHKDKWMRTTPFAFYEESTSDSKSSQGTHRVITAGNADHTYMYLPLNGNKAHVFASIGHSILDEMLPIIQPSQSVNASLQVVGHTTIDGRDLELLSDASSSDGSLQSYTEELAVDPETKLTYRCRMFKVLVSGQPAVLVDDFKFEYEQTPPPGVFDWQPPKNAVIVDNHHLIRPNRR